MYQFLKCKIYYGVNICSYVNVSPNVKIGNHVNIFSQSMIGHDTILEHYSYLQTMQF